MKCPEISVITVVFNNAPQIEATLQNILSIGYPNIQYIVVDGESNDGTSEIIRRYEFLISTYIREKDTGLYHAMNKGLQQATGEYVMFINSGDFIDKSFNFKALFANKPFADFYYGNTQIIGHNGQHIGQRRLKPPDTANWKTFRQGMLISHQAMIVKRSIAPLYNLKYRYSADFDWAIRCLKNAHTVVNTRQNMALFREGGQTSRTIIPGLNERFRIMLKHYGFVASWWAHLKFVPRFFGFYFKHRRF